jgi:hypothetical protein
MATLTGKLVADTYKALLKLIDNDILTASEKQISDGFGGGSNVFIDQNGFLRAAQFKVTGGTSSQFLKGDGSLDNNNYYLASNPSGFITVATANTLYLPIGSTTTAIAEGTRLYFTTARVLATTLAGFVAITGTVTASDTILSAIEKIWWNIENGGGGGGGGYVPYIGATQNLNLGTYGLISDFVQFNTTNSAIPVTAGTMSWNNTDGTADLRLKGGNVTLQIGQELVTRVVNKTGDDLLEENYQAVYISGAQGQRLKVDLALAVTDATSAGTLGLVTEDIDNNQEGFITTSGLVNKIDTTGDLQGETWADGDILYLSPTVAGQITNVKPLAPDHTVIMGFVVYAHANNGKIYVKVDNGYEIEELHDVQVIDRTDTDILQWYEDDLVWRNIQFGTALENAGGIIGLGDINYVPRFDGTNSISNSLIFDDLENVIVGGTIGIIPNPFGVADMLTVLNGNIAIDGAYSYRIDTHQILKRTNATGEFRIGTDVAGDFITLYAGTSEKARLTAAGNLGLSVTSPSSMIHAKDSTAYGKIIIDNTGATGGGSFSARQNGTETAIFGVSGAWQANTTSDAAIVATRAGQGIKFYTNGSATAKGGIDSVGNSFIGQLPAYYAGATNFIVQGISAAAMIGVTHMDNSIKGVFSTLNGGVTFGSYTPHPVIFTADDIESARIASDGKWLFGTIVNDNVNTVQVNGSIIATSLKKSGGIATEFLKADGSVDSNLYYLDSNPDNYIPLTAISSTAFGLTYTNTTGVISLTAGFEIPTTTDTTNWDISYLNRITSATAPLSITTNVISISQASGSVNGYLSNTDWNTFNNKTSNTGTVTSVSGTGTVSGLTLTGTVTTTGSLTLGGTLSLTSGNVTTALGFTPVTNARTLTINGISFDLTADRSWTVSGTIGGLTTNKIPKATSATTLGDSNLINDANGNLGLGVTPSTWTLFSGVIELNGATAIGAFSNTAYFMQNTVFNSGFKYKNTGTAGRYELAQEHKWFTAPSGTAGNAITFTQAMTLGSNGGLSIGTTTAASANGLLVAGTATFNINQNAQTNLIISNTTAGTGSYVSTSFLSNTSAGIGEIGKYSSTTSTYKITTAGSTYIYNGTLGDIAILNDYLSGAIKMAAGGSSTAHLTIASTGIATFSSSVIVGTTALLNFGPTSSFVGMSGNNSTGSLALYANNTQVLGFAASTGAATFSSSISATSATFSGNFTLTSAATGGVIITNNNNAHINLFRSINPTGNYGININGNGDLNIDETGVATRVTIKKTTGGININTSTTGYTLNAISSTFTQFNTSFIGSGSLINIMSRFMQDTSTNRGIAIGYAYDSQLISGIWATQDTGTLMLGVRVGSNYKSKININTTTIALDIPSSSAGLGGGQLYNDGGYVRIV